MFTQTMTSVELWAEYNADLPELMADNDRVDRSKHIDDLLRKGKQSKSCHFNKTYTTRRGNKYLNAFIYERNGGKRTGAWKWNVISIGLMDTPKGICAVLFCDEKKMALTFQAHFFKRYKERMLEVCDWKLRSILTQARSIEDIAAIYVRRNQDAALTPTGSKYGDKDHLIAPVNDGVAMFQWNGKTMQANTFVTNDMLSKKQSDKRQDVKDELQAQADFLKLAQKLSEEDNQQ